MHSICISKHLSQYIWLLANKNEIPIKRRISGAPKIKSTEDISPEMKNSIKT